MGSTTPRGTIPAGKSESTSSSTSLTPNPHHHPFHNIFTDCIHLILHYHIFHFETFVKFREKLNEWNLDTDVLWETRVRDLGASSRKVTFNEKSPEWAFLQKYAHCVEFTPKAITTYDPIDVPINWFLNNCRRREHKEAFYYLEFSDKDVYLMPEFLRCVPKLDLRKLQEVNMSEWGSDDPRPRHLTEIMKNVRGVESLDLSFSGFSIETSCFQNLRGIQNLSLSHYQEENPESIQKMFENLRGLKTLTLERCNIPSLGSLLINLRGIQELKIFDFNNSPLQAKDMRNLRGVRKLSLHGPCCETFGEFLQQLRGIEELSLKDMKIGQLTDQGFKNLRGIRKLIIDADDRSDIVTDAAFVNLRGIESLTIGYFSGITNAIFEQLRGIKELSIILCRNIQFTADTLSNLRGIRSLHWLRDEEDAPIYLGDECLRQLSSLEKLSIEQVEILSWEAFRHLKHLTVLFLSASTQYQYNEELGAPLTATLTDESFTYLKSVRRMRLLELRIEVRDFKRLLQQQMPQLSSLLVSECYVLKSSVESLSEQEGFFRVRCREVSSHDELVVAGFEYHANPKDYHKNGSYVNNWDIFQETV